MVKKTPKVGFSVWEHVIIAVGIVQGLMKLPDLLKIPYGSFVVFLLSGFIAFLFLYLFGRSGLVMGKHRPVIKPEFKDAAIVGIATGILSGFNFALKASIYTTPEFALFSGVYLPPGAYIFGVIIFFLVPLIGSLLSFFIARYLFKVS